MRLLMRPILSASRSAIHRFLSGPAVIPDTSVFGVGIGYSDMRPSGWHRPTALKPPGSVNHTLPSGPGGMAYGRAPEGMPNSVTAPIGVMRAMLRASCSVNQMLPSGPAVMARGRLASVGIGYSVIIPAGVMRPILFAVVSVNHRLPSGPAVMSDG